MLSEKLQAFESSIPASIGHDYVPAYSAEALSCNANRGVGLLEPEVQDQINMELDALVSLGVKAVTISAHFPLLYQPFWEWCDMPENGARFRDFYIGLAENIHSRGLKVMAKSVLVFPASECGLDMASYYANISYSQMAEGRAGNTCNVLQHLRPDLINLGSEPDTQSHILDMPELATPSGYGDFIGEVWDKVHERGHPQAALGAGVGSWNGRALEFVPALCSAGVEYIDFHTYPINFDYLYPRLEELVTAAQEHRLPFASAECWLLKERDEEFGKWDATSDDTIKSRNAFSFWKPLDSRFMKAMAKFTRWQKFYSMSPFWTRYFWAYVDYDDCEGLTPDEVMAKAGKAAGYGLSHGKTTATADAYAEAIAS